MYAHTFVEFVALMNTLAINPRVDAWLKINKCYGIIKMSCLDCSHFDGPFVSYSFPKSRSADDILPKYALPSPARNEPTVIPQNANLKVIVKVGKEYGGRKILFWAAEPPTKQTLVSQSQAYGQYKNMGTTLVDKNGTATFFCSPTSGL
jgi:hypothetical protein